MYFILLLSYFYIDKPTWIYVW